MHQTHAAEQGQQILVMHDVGDALDRGSDGCGANHIGRKAIMRWRKSSCVTFSVIASMK
jgi:hypothetical protein